MFLFPREAPYPGLHAIGKHAVLSQLQPRTIGLFPSTLYYYYNLVCGFFKAYFLWDLTIKKPAANRHAGCKNTGLFYPSVCVLD